MLIILAFIILFHLAAAILLFVATIHNAWWLVSPAGRDVIYTDLWYSCNATCYPAGRPGYYDPGHHFMLCQLLCIHPSALQAPTGREIHFHRYYPTTGLSMCDDRSVHLHGSEKQLSCGQSSGRLLRLLLCPGLDQLPYDSRQRLHVPGAQETQIDVMGLTHRHADIQIYKWEHLDTNA